MKQVELLTAKTVNISLEYDVKLTEDLKREGKVRDLIRKIQEERKKLGLRQNQFIKLELPDYPKEYEDIIARKVMAKSIKKGKKFLISNF